MPHDLTHRRLTAASPTTRLANGRRRFVVVRQRRGIVLIFVVVLLTLLAIMGTAYLATSRIDRQAITGRGALPGVNAPLLSDRATLQRAHLATEEAVKALIVKDLFNLSQADDVNTMTGNEPFVKFRQQVPNSTYEDYDAPGRADRWLSSLLPKRAAPNSTNIVWPWISGPLGNQRGGFEFEPFFSDPRLIGTGGFAASARYGVFTPASNREDDAGVATRNNASITAVQMFRSLSSSPSQYGPSGPPWRNTRVYPGFTPADAASGAVVTPAADNTGKWIAGDADGDGIADSGLIPVAINLTAAPNSLDRYLDRTNGVVYFASYRVVDNSAKLNIATALSNYADLSDLTVANSANEWRDETGRDDNSEIRSFLATDPAVTAPAAGQVGPNYGFFRSNVGMVELIRGLLSPINQTGDSSGTATTGYLPAQAELRRFIDARFPRLRQNPGTGYDAATTPANGLDIEKLAKTFAGSTIVENRFGTAAAAAGAAPFLYQYRSFGDLLETQVARQPTSPGGYLWTSGTAAPPVDASSLAWLGVSNTVGYSAKGGTLAHPFISPTTAEEALNFSTRLSAPNINNNGQTPWSWFPPDAVGLWFGWTQDFDVENSGTTPPLITALDAPQAQDRAFYFQPPTGSGLATVRLPRSPRSLLTTYSGVTSSVPQRKDFNSLADGLPIGMPAYSISEARDGTHSPAIAASVLGDDPPVAPTVPNDLNAFWYPAAKVSAATSTKEQLWRGYWSAMTRMGLENIAGVPTPRWDAVERILPTTPPPPATWTPARVYDAFRTSDRHPSNENASGTVNDIPERPTDVLTPRQMTLIRSAVAACNTIDLRDEDNDITAMDVDITDDHAAADRLYMRVYGTEKQLVISGVYMEDRDTLTGTTDGGYVAIEIFNPTDRPIRLDTYRLTIVTRTVAPPTVTKVNGEVDPGATPVVIPLGAAATDVLEPGGYVVIETEDTGAPVVAGPYDPAAASLNRGVVMPADNRLATATPQVYRYNANTTSPLVAADFARLLTLLTSATRDQELVLTRTRREDGVPFVDGTTGAAGSIRSTIENEVLTAPMTLVPVDAVDFRLANVDTTVTGTTPATDALRLSYLRPVPAAAAAGTNTAATPLASAPERTHAWKCFYAGLFYPLRPAAGARDPAMSIAGLDIAGAEFAWKHLTPTATTAEFAPAATPRAPIATSAAPGPKGIATAFLAPPIPIQNFKPFDPYTTTPGGVGQYGQATLPPELRGAVHLLNKFPFGSPFARDGDLLAVPYIGTYKIYRSIGGATPVLYDYVPLTMDAVAVAPEPAAVGTPGGEIKTVGRFDPRTNGVTPASRYSIPANGIANEWAANLTTFVSARQAPHSAFLPDMPDASRTATYYVTPAGTADDQRWAQDGPVTGTGAANTYYSDVRWTTFVQRDPGAPPDTTLPKDTVTNSTNRRRGERLIELDETPPLVQGLINVNTAPQIVLRQLPWLVHAAAPGANGVVDAAIDPDLRTYVNNLDLERIDRIKVPATPWDAAADPAKAFGFRSLLNLTSGTDNAMFATQIFSQPTANGGPGATAPDLLSLGMLNPVNRNEVAANYVYDALNPTRVSNLATTRSDVFTVYVTVQAWTWVGNISGANQATDTRLVGERRSSFVVDRSRISQTQFDVTNLITIPIERE